MQRVLIVEDDLALGQGIALALQNGSLQFDVADTLAAARLCLAKGDYQLVLLDVNLPDGSGLDLLRGLRQTGQTPVILLTANDLETDVVAGFSLGASDYVTKPFSLAILRARAEAQLRKGVQRAACYSQGPFRFDFDELTFFCENEPVELSKTEQKLLRLLVENPGRTLPRERLVDRVWADGADFVEENALSVAMRRLRAKLGPACPIKTVYGVGYSWEVQP